MEIKDYLIVYGHNTKRGGSCYKETEIDCNELIKFMPIIKKIHKTINNEYNWDGGNTIERLSDGSYLIHNHLHEMYPEFDSKLLDEFNEYLPNGITHIKSIKVFSGQMVQII